MPKTARAICFSLSAAFVLSSCVLDGADGIRSNLGEYQYMGLDPQLSFDVQKAEFSSPKDQYSGPSVNYTVLIRQNNASFPIKKYVVSAKFSVVDKNGSIVDSVLVQGNIDNGVLSTSGIEELYSAKRRLAGDVAALKLEPDFYDWWPLMRRKPHPTTAP